MLIKSIGLRNFRNYESLQINFEKEFNIIYGNNAQGKTNIIEAIFLCASGRSHRTSKDSELVKYGEDAFDIKLVLEKQNVKKEIHIAYNNEDRKKIKINDIAAKKIGDLMGHLNAVMFSPEDLLLIKQGPAERRRFADIALSQLKPSYFYDLQQYAKILFQRNSLLKNITIKRDLEDTLEVWDKHLAKTGARIMKERERFVKRMNELAKSRHNDLTNSEENLTLKYDPSFQIRDDNYNDLEGCFKCELEKNKEREIYKGSTIIGPHRDDIDIILNDESTKIYGSQGQQRTSVLSMKLAEIDLMKEESGEYPVLLLDDVLSELDDRRKEFLIESIKNVQTFITCTDRRFFKAKRENTSFFYVENGNIDYTN
ncbi:MAG: DNA replication/repair protein RecF [Clostridiaceae bacterium]